MSPRTQLVIEAREAGRNGLPCPVKKGEDSPDDLLRFQAWLLTTTARETGATIIPEFAESEHPDLQLCRPKKDSAL